MAKYATLADLINARHAGAVPADAVLWLDNDQTCMHVDGEEVFEAHPGDLLEQALDLLQINHEPV